MNSLTHFLFASVLLISIFGNSATHPISLPTLFLFAFIFGVLVDLDVFIRMLVLKDTNPITRTWVQEPFGLVAIGVPLAIVANLIWGSPYAWLVLLPYASHIFLDYIATHDVRPFDPFSKRVVHVGLIRTSYAKVDSDVWTAMRTLFFTPESYVTILVAVMLVITLVR